MNDREFDKKLTAAMFDVPLPAGLAERLLDRLSQDAGGEESRLAATIASGTVTTGRGLVFSLGLLASAAVLLVAVWLGARGNADLTAQSVLDGVILAFEAGNDRQGTPVAEKPAPGAYPVSRAVAPTRGMRWRTLQGDVFAGYEGVIYDFSGRDGVIASLYVVDTGVLEGFDSRPTEYPFTTAGCCAASWQESGLLYVLVVQGDISDYRSFLNVPSNPVARNCIPRALFGFAAASL
jgi:hypothetical protein